MRLPGAKWLRHAAHWLHSRFVGGALILGYHSIGHAEFDPHSLHVRPSHFAEHLEVLVRHARPVALGRVVTGRHGDCLPPRAVAITFDDGYADALHVVLPLLERYGVPATVFVTTGTLGQEFWWHELARLLLGRSAVHPAQLPGYLGPKVDGVPEQTHQRYYHRLASLIPEQRETVLGELRALATSSPGEARSIRCLTSTELSQLAQSELITIGAHSVSHARLATLPLERQRREISDSRACLQALSTHPVTLFSYPHGSTTAATRSLVAEAGFEAACGSNLGVAWSGSDAFDLPRFWIPDWDGDQFGRWLGRWLRGRPRGCADRRWVP